MNDCETITHDANPADGDVISAMDRTATAFEALQACWRTQIDLAVHERMALSQLRQSGAMTMTDLARRLSLSRAAVTSLVDQLEAHKYVERTADAHDRRRTLVQLCAHANEVLDEVAVPFTDEMRQWIDARSDNERSLVLNFLETWQHSAQRLTTASDDLPT